MRVKIVGIEMPGRVICGRDGQLLSNLHVGPQIGRDPDHLVPADAPRAEWNVEVQVVATSAGHDFRGPAVQRKKGERFVYAKRMLLVGTVFNAVGYLGFALLADGLAARRFW